MVAPNVEDQIRLSRLSPGQGGVIRELLSSGFVRRRLLDLGFCPGTAIEVVRRSPLGDPTCYRIRGSAVALRSQDAGRILVAPQGGPVGDSGGGKSG
ncbi:MAG: FeoA family protein [Planctomycetota bacterium]|jgi:ferrous iron transport protein A